MELVRDVIGYVMLAAAIAILFNLRVYLGFPGWGWRMYGIGYKTTWFLGLSIQIKPEQHEQSK